MKAAVGSESAQRRIADLRMNTSEYSGREKAAIVLLSLRDQASGLLEHLGEDEIRDVSEAMASLGLVPQHVVDGIVAEFFDRLANAGTIVGSFEQTERMLSSILPPERVEAVMQELRGPAGRSVWEKLSNVKEEVLAGYLANEYPQTVAVVLTKVPPSLAAKVLSLLPHAFAVETVNRMLGIDSVRRDVLDQVEGTLRTEFINNAGRATRRDNHEVMADIFNNLDKHRKQRLLGVLGSSDPTGAERIESLMFVFEDLGKLDASAIQTLLRVSDKSDLALALKGASDHLRQLFLSNMSERGGKLLRDEMQAMGPVRLKDVEAAQARMVAAAKDLAARGEILLVGGGAEDDELVY